MRGFNLYLAALLVLLAASASAQTAQVAPHASKTLQYQYTSDVNGVTLWVDMKASPGFIQYDGFTCRPMAIWQVHQVYPLPTATNRTQPAFSLHATCSLGGAAFDLIETGYAYWGGYGLSAGVYYYFQSGTITQSTY